MLQSPMAVLRFKYGDKRIQLGPDKQRGLHSCGGTEQTQSPKCTVNSGQPRGR